MALAPQGMPSGVGANGFNTSEIVTALVTMLKTQNLSVTALQAIVASQTSIATNTATIAAQSQKLFTGSFTLTATASLVVPNVNVVAGSIIIPFATSASAATLMGSAKSLYNSAKSAGVSFTVATGNATSAAGGETFSYLIINP